MSDMEVLAVVQHANRTGLLTRQQYKTLVGQIRSGDAQGAARGLKKILQKKEV